MEFNGIIIPWLMIWNTIIWKSGGFHSHGDSLKLQTTGAERSRRRAAGMDGLLGALIPCLKRTRKSLDRHCKVGVVLFGLGQKEKWVNENILIDSRTV